MKKPVVKKARVERDLAEFFDIIAMDKIEPALRFLEVAEASFERLAEAPGLGMLWSQWIGGWRRCAFIPRRSPIGVT